MSSSPKPVGPLHDLLTEAETELHRRLREACEAEERGVTTDSAREIRELEDSLLAAAMAAEKVLTVRRHLDKGAQPQQPLPQPPQPPQSSAAPAEQLPSEDTSVREFDDETGRRWRAWPVTPNLARAKEASRRSLGDFQDGWFCFEALDNSGRRRLPQRGRRWSDLPLAELRRLLADAITVPERKPRDGGSSAGATKLN
jgi:hypothetical protein